MSDSSLFTGPVLDDQFTVETPEQIDVAYDIAGIGARFIAAIIDHTLIGLVLSLGCAIVGALANQFTEVDTGIVFGLLGIGAYLGLCGYYIFFETVWNGRTPGKRVVGLQVVRTGGRPIGFLGSATRNIVRLADFLPVLYGVGVVVMFWDRRSRRLGDMAAGALTVKEQRLLTLDSLTTPQQPVPTPQVSTIMEQHPIPNLHVLTTADLQLMQDYLAQRHMLSLDARRRLAGQLLVGLQARLGYPISGDPEAFLRACVAQHRALTAAQPPAVQ